MIQFLSSVCVSVSVSVSCVSGLLGPKTRESPRISERSDLARIINKAKVKQLLTKAGAVCGVTYERKGKDFTEEGPVILATGGFGADFTDDS